MSKPVPPPTPAANSAPARRMIVAPTVGGYGPSLGKFLVVWACSTGINVAIVLLALVVFSAIGAASAPVDVQPETNDSTEVADTTKEYDLTNTDIGEDTSVPLAYNVDRIEEVSVPGKVDPTAAVGIENATEAAPTNIPPPPGAGGGTGAGSGATREKLLREGGGNARSEKAVADGLKFLALHKCPDGRWRLNEF